MKRESARRYSRPVPGTLAVKLYERLFFEVYGQAFQGRPHATALLDGIVDTWLKPLTEVNITRGMPPGQAGPVPTSDLP